jgi:flagellar biosynthesis GTPase FlhF
MKHRLIATQALLVAGLIAAGSARAAGDPDVTMDVVGPDEDVRGAISQVIPLPEPVREQTRARHMNDAGSGEGEQVRAQERHEGDTAGSGDGEQARHQYRYELRENAQDEAEHLREQSREMHQESQEQRQEIQQQTQELRDETRQQSAEMREEGEELRERTREGQ